jgi:two-component system cell cycle response regulator
MARLLVVEDNRVNLDLMTYLLRAFGHDVAAVDNGHAALDALRRAPVDLVVCDVQMPGMDGLQLLREVRADPSTAALRFIAVTAAAMVGDRERLLAAGFDGYLAKPIDPQTFARQVEGFVHVKSADDGDRS